MFNQSPKDELKCGICNRVFGKKSSLVRHSKRCTKTPRPSLRQKSCYECASTKSKCDLRRPSCGRCTSRKVACKYPVSAAGHDETTSQLNREENHLDPSLIQPLIQMSVPVSTSPEHHNINVSNSNVDPYCLGLLLNAPSPASDVGLSFLDDADLVSSLTQSLCNGSEGTNPSSTGSPGMPLSTNMWISPFYAGPETTPVLTKHSMEYLFRVLRTWPCMVAREMQLPPIFHSSHVTGQPFQVALANCFTLAKLWYGQSDASSEMVREAILKEMQIIFNSYWTYDETHLLASLQALVIYIIMLMFPTKKSKVLPIIDNSIFLQLQSVVYYFVGVGLVLPEERDHIRPNWESWIQMNSKRRSILTLYLIHWSYSIYHCLPSFVCEELGFMPAPASKMLWQASNKATWDFLYNRWLSSWHRCGYLQGEFVMIEEGIKLDPRTEMWLEETDEFGMMFMTIVNAADREPIFTANHGTQPGTI